jgi:hypothetical protein
MVFSSIEFILPILDGEHFSITAKGCNEKLSHQASASSSAKG